MPLSVSAFRHDRWALPLLAVIMGLGLAAVTFAAEELPAVVATVQDQPIAADELTSTLSGDLLRVEMQRYRVLKEGLDRLISERLKQLEAAKRQISPKQLIQEEVTAKATLATEEQVKQFYEANKKRIRQPLEQIAPRIEKYLNDQAQEKRRNAFYGELRQRYKVTVALEPPKVDVSSDDDPALGAQDATVTIIEFSDFQCPYCRRVQPTLKRLLADYEGRVKLVFRDFPLRNIHPQAQKAAEAAQCADEQQQFWPYHDKLFDNTAFDDKALKTYAGELSLDVAQFTACLDSNKYAQEVEADLQDGRSVGVSSTPSFFINGRPLSGAASYESFQELVEAALERGKSAKRATP